MYKSAMPRRIKKFMAESNSEDAQNSKGKTLWNVLSVFDVY